MGKIVSALVFLSVVTVGLRASSTESYIVLTAFKDREKTSKQVQKYKALTVQNKILKSMKVSLSTEQIGSIGILKVGPFRDTDKLTLGYLELRQIFPQAFIMDASKKIIKEPLVYSAAKMSDNRVLWMALFGLGVVGIFALFVSSSQIRKLKKRHQKLKRKQKEIEKKQSALLEQMGEKIQDAALQNVKKENKLLATPLEKYDHQKIKIEISDLKKYDEELLRTTYEMIDFLKIKSGNIVVKQEAFQLSNMLHKLTNSIALVLRHKYYKLYYDIAYDVTRYLIGDTNRIFQVLQNLLLDIVERKEYGEITVHVQITDDEEKLVFRLESNTLFLTPKEIETLFVPESWEDVHEKKRELDFYVLNELVENMNGSLEIVSKEAKGTQYTLSLPYIRDLDNKSRKKELIEVLSDKKALLIDKNLQSVKILTEILHTFKIETFFKSSENLDTHRPNLDGIDFVILRSEDISKKVFDFFKELDKKESPDVIVVHDIFDDDDKLGKSSEIADSVLYSPLIVGDVEEVLKQLYIRKTRRKSIDKRGLKEFKILDKHKVDIEDFAKFKDKTILIVEDNFVSQQVMSSILSASQLKVIKAENGQEVLDILDEYSHIDLIFMDMNMPIIDGFDVTREIRKNNKYKKVPIVAVTGLGFNYEVEKMIQAGVDACIIKPYKFGQLYVALERFLDPDSYGDTPDIKNIEIGHINKNILDVQKGLSYVRSENFYSEIVAQILLALRNSDELVKEMIVKDQVGELRAFCVDALGLSATVGAVSYASLLKEMLMEIKKDEIYLSQYIPKYKAQWLELEAEMKRFLRS